MLESFHCGDKLPPKNKFYYDAKGGECVVVTTNCYAKQQQKNVFGTLDECLSNCTGYTLYGLMRRKQLKDEEET